MAPRRSARLQSQNSIGVCQLTDTTETVARQSSQTQHRRPRQRLPYPFDLHSNRSPFVRREEGVQILADRSQLNAEGISEFLDDYRSFEELKSTPEGLYKAMAWQSEILEMRIRMSGINITNYME